ncbi:hypothetical protein ABI59_14165 [Acidobacteria bacterium Mor1]|nr:hypothetical protein ABI59_14165 [Acidobacteria bacterium Mor1]
MSRPYQRAAAVAAILLAVTMGTAFAENIDPDATGQQYAYGENAGWFNAQPSGPGGPGVQVGDDELSGWIWGENTGWVSLSCKNTLSCATVDYGVAHDGNGALSGFAWSENSGWINFGPATSGVTVSLTTGELAGYAWSENLGWISFSCENTGSCATVDYRVRSKWSCDPLPAAPTDEPELMVDLAAGVPLLSWDRVDPATGSDIVVGDLDCLRTSGGDFAACTSGCVDDNRTTLDALAPAGGSQFFLVRSQNCGGSGSYSVSGGGQVGTRDDEVLLSGNDCAN